MTGLGVTPEGSSLRVGCVVSWLLTGDVTSASLLGKSSSEVCGGFCRLGSKERRTEGRER